MANAGKHYGKGNGSSNVTVYGELEASYHQCMCQRVVGGKYPVSYWLRVRSRVPRL